MSYFKYTPDDDIKIEKINAVRQLCSWLRSHEDGIPEWIKNSSDAYEREDRIESERVIVIFFDYGRKTVPPSISCLDFCGMTSAQIEKYFRHWADSEASFQEYDKVSTQGGHGQGGKCYMTQMFSDYASLYTVKGNLGNTYGVKGGDVRFGYIPDRKVGRDFKVDDIEQELDKVLYPVRSSIKSLPRAAREALRNSNGFTLVSGFAPNGYRNRIPVKNLIRDLSQHQEMLHNIEFCNIFVICNGKLESAKRALKLPEIPPKEGGESPREFEIPSRLKDPQSEEDISTTNEGQLHRGILTLYTSATSMRWSLKSRHTIRFLSGKFGSVGYIHVTELDVHSGYKDHIYGVCNLEALKGYKQLSRGPLAKSPLTRAIHAFISEKVQSYAEEFEARDRRKYTRKEKNAITKMNAKLDQWKNKFLDQVMSGLWGSGDVGSLPPPPPLPKGDVVRMELQITHQKAGLGITMRPTLAFFDKEGRRIRAVPYKWVSEDNNIAMVHDQLMLIETFSYGLTKIYAQTLSTVVRSNSVPLEVVHIKKIRISPSFLEVPQGSRKKLEVLCELDDNKELKNVLVDWTENDSSVVKVSSAGLVYGFSQGETEVVAWDSNCEASNPATIKVVYGKDGGKGKDKGKGYPRVLVSGEDFDPDPITNEWRIFSPDQGPICQELSDVDNNIWWINSAAPLATLFLDKDKGYGYESREWRIYHIDRFIDVIVQVIFTQGPKERESLSASQWVNDWMYNVSEIQAAAVQDLDGFISDGNLDLE